MTPEQREKIKPKWENYVRDETERMIRDACGMGYGQNYKKYVPLMELINYKIDAGSVYCGRNVDKNTLKFQKFVDTIDKFVVLVASQWPFIDMDGIDLTWTSEQIVEKVIEMYGNVQPLKFDGVQPTYKDNAEDVKKIVKIIERAIGPHVNKRKKINKTMELRKAILEAKGIEAPIVHKSWGDEVDYYAKSVEEVVQPIITKIEEEIAKEFPNDNLYISKWSSINKICKEYQEKHKF